jgi:hypothetical protein
MTNIFLDQPEFIEKDPRVRRPEKIGCIPSAEVGLTSLFV